MLNELTENGMPEEETVTKSQEYVLPTLPVPPKRPDPELYFTDLPFEEALDPRVLEIWNRPQYEQRTPEWYLARMTCISASSMAAALMQTPEACDYYVQSCNPEFKPNPKKNCSYKDTQTKLIMDKCGLGEKFTGNEYTLWGQKYEQIVSNVYSQLNEVDMLEFGLLIHPEIPFVGASPDGISTKGVMLEIKCPPIRKVKPYPPIYYFIQILMQLECTSLTDCDYMDCSFIEYKDVQTWTKHAIEWENGEGKDAKHHLYGIILSYEDGFDEDMNEPILRHIYAPPIVVSKDDFEIWAKDTEDEYLYGRGTPLIRTHYKLNEYYIHRVRANKKWFTDNLPTMRGIWEKILHGRTADGQAALQKIKDDKESLLKARREKKRLAESMYIYLDLDGGEGNDSIQTPYEPAKNKKFIHKTCLL